MENDEIKLLKIKYDNICPCCMERHRANKIFAMENNVYNGVPVKYKVEYWYCSNADETFADERQLQANFQSMKTVYKKKIKDTKV